MSHKRGPFMDDEEVNQNENTIVIPDETGKVLDYMGPALQKFRHTMNDSGAIMTHLDNMVATFGEESVKYVIERHLKMKRRVIKPKVA